MDTNIKCKKNQYEGGNKAYKIFTSRVVEGNIPNTISRMELFMATLKMKNNFFNEYQYEMQKSWDGGGNNAFKIFTSWVDEEKYYMQARYLVWSCPTKKKKQFSELSKKYTE